MRSEIIPSVRYGLLGPKSLGSRNPFSLRTASPRPFGVRVFDEGGSHGFRLPRSKIQVEAV